jgi:hypothetical protein
MLMPSVMVARWQFGCDFTKCFLFFKLIAAGQIIGYKVKKWLTPQTICAVAECYFMIMISLWPGHLVVAAVSLQVVTRNPCKANFMPIILKNKGEGWSG